jgi:hypothetical protein
MYIFRYRYISYSFFCIQWHLLYSLTVPQLSFGPCSFVWPWWTGRLKLTSSPSSQQFAAPQVLLLIAQTPTQSGIISYLNNGYTRNIPLILGMLIQWQNHLRRGEVPRLLLIHLLQYACINHIGDGPCHVWSILLWCPYGPSCQAMATATVLHAAYGSSPVLLPWAASESLRLPRPLLPCLECHAILQLIVMRVGAVVFSTAAGGRTPGNDIITPSQCTKMQTDGYNRHFA